MSTKNPNNHLLPVLAALAGHILWGFSYMFTRVALQTASPTIQLADRYLLAFVVMNLLLLTGKFKISLKSKPLFPILSLGAIDLIYAYVESCGILYTNATYSGVVLSVVPIAGLLLAAIFLKEYPTKKQLIFCVFPIAGVIILTLSGSELGIVSPIGIFFLICTLFASASYKTANRKLSSSYTAFERAYVMIGMSAVAFLISGLITSKGDVSQFITPFFDWHFALATLALGALCSVLCNTIVNYAAAKMSVMTLSVYGSISTVFSAFCGVIFLGEPMSPTLFFGSVMILFGVWQVTRAADISNVPELKQRAHK